MSNRPRSSGCVAVCPLRSADLLPDPFLGLVHAPVAESLARAVAPALIELPVRPALAEAAMEGRLPRGFCIKRLTDLPMLWSEQWGAIGLQAPAQVRAELR